jgi:hypothetical protein
MEVIQGVEAGFGQGHVLSFGHNSKGEEFTSKIGKGAKF